MPVSLRDVARVAGVSPRTVSNVVNDYAYVKAETRQRVQEVIRSLNYRPNVSARKLRNGKTGIVALALPKIAEPYFAELADRVQRYAARHGITLLVEQTGGTRERELQVLDAYQSNIVDGLLLSAMAITAEDLALRPLDVPVVLLGESVDRGGLLHVSIDNVAAAASATRHLLDLGRRSIAAVGAGVSVANTGPAERRLQGYTEAMADAGLPLIPQLTFHTAPWNRARGYEVAAGIAAHRRDVDALFCFNDSLALGALKAFADHGVGVPDDIAVLGWDDIEEATYATPALTTIAPDKEQIVTVAVDALRSDTSSASLRDVSCSFELRTRASTIG